MTTDAKLFFGIGKFIHLFPLNQVASFTARLSMVTGERKTRLIVKFSIRCNLALQIHRRPAIGRVTGRT